LQNALAELGGVPAIHRTDRLTPAIPPGTTGAEFTQRYRALLSHYGLEGQSDPARHKATRTATSSSVTTASNGRSISS